MALGIGAIRSSIGRYCGNGAILDPNMAWIGDHPPSPIPNNIGINPPMNDYPPTIVGPHLAPHYEQRDAAAMTAYGKPATQNLFKRIGSAFNNMSDEKKMTTLGVIGAAVAVIVIGIAVIVLKIKKGKLEKKHVAQKKTMIENARQASGLPIKTMPELPGEAYEQYLMSSLKLAQHHHDEAVKTTDPLHRLAQSSTALGIVESLMIAAPNEELIFQITHGVKIGEYRTTLIELKNSTIDRIQQWSALAPVSASMRPNTNAANNPTNEQTEAAQQPQGAVQPTRRLAKESLSRAKRTVVSPASSSQAEK